jgi:sortase A
VHTSNTSARRRRWLVAIERSLITAGLLLLGFYAVARFHSIVVSRAARRELKENKAPAATEVPSAGAMLPPDSSAAAGTASGETAVRRSRIRVQYRSGTPLALLRIPRLGLEVPVLEGTDQTTLNAGVGRIPGTALPGEAGNIGIAGHRDGFFAGLKNIIKGDEIELLVKQQTDTYVVDMIEITSPDDVSVLQRGTQPELTLVTCYPFSFIGPAPRRFIVRASLQKN